MTRYDQCDSTCTVDCGHCKGQGPPWTPEAVDAVVQFSDHFDTTLSSRDRCRSCRAWGRRLLAALVADGLLATPQMLALREAAEEWRRAGVASLDGQSFAEALESMPAADAKLRAAVDAWGGETR